MEIWTVSHTHPFRFRARDGRKFTISLTMTSIPGLVRFIEKHLPSRVYERAKDEIERFKD
jgi:hypothetical protein